MLRLKGCPRCSGDVYFDWDFYGWFEQCLQCSYTHYLHNAVKAEKETRASKKSGAKEVTQAT